MNRLKIFIFICIITLLMSYSCMFASDPLSVISTPYPESGWDKLSAIATFILTRLSIYAFLAYCLLAPIVYIRDKKLEALAADVNKVNTIYNKFMQLNITPLEFSGLTDNFFVPMNAFRLIFLDLIRRNIISIDEVSLHIHAIKPGMLKDYEHKFIKILLDNLPFAVANEYLNFEKTVSLTLFFNFLNLHNVKILRSMNKMQEMLFMIRWKNRSLRKEAIILRGYFKSQRGRYPDSTYGIFLSNNHNHGIDLMALYSLASVTPKTFHQINLIEARQIQVSALDSEAFYQNIGRALDAYAARYVGIERPKIYK